MKTQLEMARDGIISWHMIQVATDEHLPQECIRDCGGNDHLLPSVSTPGRQPGFHQGHSLPYQSSGHTLGHERGRTQWKN